VCERDFGVAACGEHVLTPEFFLVDAMAAFDLPVLLRPPGLDVPMPDARRFNRQFKGQRKF
jgi:hypothetical protein